MAKKTYEFAIDDALGTADNLTAFANELAGDAPLAAALTPHLEPLASGRTLDSAAIWNLLFEASAAAVPAPADGTDGTE
ncbi:hypothetical protein [Sphingopyxis sp.]|uniref:hypothetical protein n=1 Tax=Sphingopyxis sp. TaxID=1908224 RepID=UPI002D780B8A|nr:hypothetical protein [Sphingopyxis sp.]HET6525148.1 hypothetical protein [Sphingopyxis sp.]